MVSDGVGEGSEIAHSTFVESGGSVCLERWGTGDVESQGDHQDPVLGHCWQVDDRGYEAVQFGPTRGEECHHQWMNDALTSDGVCRRSRVKLQGNNSGRVQVVGDRAADWVADRIRKHALAQLQEPFPVNGLEELEFKECPVELTTYP